MGASGPVTTFYNWLALLRGSGLLPALPLLPCCQPVLLVEAACVKEQMPAGGAKASTTVLELAQIITLGAGLGPCRLLATLHCTGLQLY